MGLTRMADRLMGMTTVTVYVTDAVGQRQQCLDSGGSGNDVGITEAVARMST